MTTWMVTVAPEYADHWDIARREGLWDTTTTQRQVRMQPGDRAYFRTTSSRGRLLGSVILTSEQFDLGPADPRPWRDTRDYRARFTFTVEAAHPAVATTASDINAHVTLRGAQQQSVRVVDPGPGEDWLYSRIVDVPHGYTSEDVAAADALAKEAAAIDPDADTRRLVLAARYLREGQPAFRRALLDAYGERCAITGVAFPAVLEAAHISPYRGVETHQVDNGILLRADLHTLFDLHLLTIVAEEGRFVARCAPDIQATEYGRWHQADVAVPSEAKLRPRPEYLERHQAECAWLGTPGRQA